MTLRRIALTGIVVLTMGGIALAEEPLELVNPGFEETEGEAVGVPSPDWEQQGAPPGWSVWYGETARAANAVMAWTAAAHTGSRSVSVRSAAGPVVIMQQVPVEVGEAPAVQDRGAHACRSGAARLQTRRSRPHRRLLIVRPCSGRLARRGPAGAWTVSVRDAATGVAGEATVVLGQQ